MDWVKTDEASEVFSVADLVKQTASQFVFENVLPGFVYYNEYGAYYNHDTGYFYYPESSLYFHPFTQLYYYYNEQTKNYEIYKNEDRNDNWTKKNYKRRATNLFGEEFVLDAKIEDIVVAELIFDLVDKCSFLSGDYSNRKTKKRKIFDEEIFDEFNVCTSQTYFDPALSSDDEMFEKENNEELNRRIDEEQITCNAPCIRLLEFPSNNLHIITILGASIGFGQNADIQLLLNSEQFLNKEILFYINYFEEENSGIYKLKVEIDDIILKLNGKQILLNNEYIICHGDQIQIGNSHSLNIHIHRGLNTCQGCEPGILNSLNQSSEQINIKKYSKNVEHHRQLKLIKQQYGLLDNNQDFQNNEYLDRAKQRRKLNNSNLLQINDNKKINEAAGIYIGCKAAPVPGCSTDSVNLYSSVSRKEAISENNKGFKLLKGMGWNEGEGLGKTNQGMKGPIETIIKNDRKGLGMFTKNIKENVANGKLAILEKIRQRYEQINQK